MGQRSQIYVRCSGNLIVANYYQWNFAERMISRARWGIEEIDSVRQYGKSLRFDSAWWEKLCRVFDVNFDMHDYQIHSDIIKEWEELFQNEPFNRFVFDEQDNNNGQLIVDISDNWEISYAFFSSDCTNRTPMSAAEYMRSENSMWEQSKYIDEDGKKKCAENIEAISKMARLMTEQEVQDFLTYDYGYHPEKI